MKILHCADIHLDSAMQTHMDKDQAIQRNAEILKTFTRMIDYAKSHQIAVVLIAGDLFDRDRVTRRTVESVLDSIQSAPQIDFLYVSGNHDAKANAFLDKDIPENFKVFTNDWTTFDYGDVSISGIEMTKDNATTLYDQLPVQNNRINIVMLHGQIVSNSGVDLVNLSLLKQKNIQYLALGHIHSYACDRIDENGIYCYPGCLEGRGFDECGPKGFVTIDTDTRKLSCTFIPFASRMLHRVNVDVSGAATNHAVYQKMKEAAADISKNDMVEFVLKGQTDFSSQIASEYLYSLIHNDYYFVKLKDEMKPAYDPDVYSKDISLKGEFIRLVMQNKDLSEEEKLQIIRTGLEALSDEEITV